MSNCDAFLSAYSRVLTQGETLNIRGSLCKEVRNLSLDIDPCYPITSFEDRKFNLKYAKKETLWYIKGDRFDTSICEVAGAWNNLIQPDGGINSNYGQDIFEGPRQFDWCVEELIRDHHSRRAVIILGRPEMLTKANTDHRCTMYISYAIRNWALHQNVRMRSNDIIYGMTNDVFFFGLLHQMMYVTMKAIYPQLKLGTYNHSADSMHVYDRHFDMLENIVTKGRSGWSYLEDVPRFKLAEEVVALRHVGDKLDGHTDMTRWLMED